MKKRTGYFSILIISAVLFTVFQNFTTNLESFTAELKSSLDIQNQLGVFSFVNKIGDPANVFDVNKGQFTVAESGFYLVNLNLTNLSVEPENSAIKFKPQILVNGVPKAVLEPLQIQSLIGLQNISLQSKLLLDAGDIVSIGYQVKKVEGKSFPDFINFDSKNSFLKLQQKASPEPILDWQKTGQIKG